MTGLTRRGVREHRRDAGEPRHECSAMYLYTIESVPFTRRATTGRLRSTRVSNAYCHNEQTSKETPRLKGRMQMCTCPCAHKLT